VLRKGKKGGKVAAKSSRMYKKSTEYGSMGRSPEKTVRGPRERLRKGRRGQYKEKATSRASSGGGAHGMMGGLS